MLAVYWHVLPSVVAAQGLLFIDLIALNREGLDLPSDDLPKNDFIPQLTLFYSGEIKGIKLLGEYLFNDLENQLGRLQAGIDIGTSNTLWLGRTDNPASYWRDQYHHGGWLQPTITRPGIAEYEIAGGLAPSHTTGILFESGATVRNSEGFSFIGSFGYGPTLNSNGLQVPKLVDDNRDKHNSSYAFRTFYNFGTLTAGNEAGLTGSVNHIAAKSQAFTEVRQWMLGAYINWQFKSLTLTTELSEVDSDTKDEEGKRTAIEHFHNIYLQGIYSLNDNWNIYARAERTSDIDNGDYLVNFPLFLSQKDMLGFSYNLTRRQIIKLEADHSERIYGESYYQVTVEWSFIYP
ncbi:hypothetical protein MNBD_GAMMA09-2971 [hydrothermal vent metagenome]|uniref:Uncharacterized protein n=1 Tax=hydrothermal vent metagenome TaxID=652676 RepID=A0A3B0YAQ0_9ZZZZ